MYFYASSQNLLPGCSYTASSVALDVSIFLGGFYLVFEWHMLHSLMAGHLSSNFSMVLYVTQCFGLVGTTVCTRSQGDSDFKFKVVLISLILSAVFPTDFSS